MEKDLVRLSKAMSRALRHAPQEYGLTLDGAGWVPTAALLAALRADRPAWRDLAEADLAAVLAQSEKQRFEMGASRIRALYGHSVPERLAKTPETPPPVLYHGTPWRAVSAIMAAGLRPMGRQYVHLSIDTETAASIGARKAGSTAILTADAAAAHRDGVHFYRGNAAVWLADVIPPRYLTPTPESGA